MAKAKAKTADKSRVVQGFSILPGPQDRIDVVITDDCDLSIRQMENYVYVDLMDIDAFISELAKLRDNA